MKSKPLNTDHRADAGVAEPAASEAHSHPEAKQRQNSFGQIASILAIVAIAFLLAFLIKAFLFQPYIVDGQSMEATLQNSDRLIVNKIPRTVARIDGHAYVPHRGDIIVFNQSNLPGYTGQKQLIKRVIGLPGDQLVVKNGKITIYNSVHPKGFNPDTTGSYRITAPITTGDINLKLKANQVFVCGDNRDNSEDSRYFGPVDVGNIVGKLAFRILPLGKAQHF